MTGSIKVSGAWKSTRRIDAKVGGVWKGVNAAYTKVDGAWKQWFAGIPGWSLKAAPTTAIFTGAVYHDGKIYLFNGGSNLPSASVAILYHYSSDGGNTWATGTFPVAWKVGRAATNGSRIVVTPYAGNVGYYTDDGGTTWTSVTLPTGTSTAITQLIWSPIVSKFLATTDNTSTTGLLHSSDGITWSSVDNIDGGIDITHNTVNGRFFVAPAGATRTRLSYANNVGYTSANEWNSTSNFAYDDIQTVAYGNGLVLAASVSTLLNAATLAVSSDNGATWTSSTPPDQIYPASASSIYAPPKIQFINGYFYFTRGANPSNYKPGAVYRTADGITWESAILATVLVSGQMNYASVWVSDGTYIYGFGYNNLTAGTNRFVKGPV